MIQFVSLISTFLLFILISASTWADGGPSTFCHRLEGVLLAGCSPQAKPLDCGPPKPCPPCRFYETCSTMIVQETTGGGVCIAYGEPTCEDTPDGRICGSAPCIEYTQAGCANRTRTCGVSPTSVDSEGTYDCDISECRCPSAPEGLVNCNTSLTCQENNPCPNN